MTSGYHPFSFLPRGAHVMIAFSGGVDSSVAAYLCREAGMRVRAVTMSLLGPDRFDASRAEAVAKKLDLPLEIVDLSADFERLVLRKTWEGYAAGRTPNPCAVCNPVFKFGRLMEFARERGCDALATGHYARLVRGDDGLPRIQKGICAAKDQSYFLFGLSRGQLDYACFPLGGLEKSEVRAMASTLGLPNADAAESQDACFAPPDGSNLAEMLRCRFRAEIRPGNFISPEGTVLGRHGGIHAYTVGQRKGTGVALGKPAYVRKIEAESGNIVLTPDAEKLLSGTALLGPLHLHLPEYENRSEFSCAVKIRYRSPAVPARITVRPDGCTVKFETPQRAVTPGQAAVLYDGDTLIGGAWILSAG